MTYKKTRMDKKSRTVKPGERNMSLVPEQRTILEKLKEQFGGPESIVSCRDGGVQHALSNGIVRRTKIVSID